MTVIASLFAPSYKISGHVKFSAATPDNRPKTLKIIRALDFL